MVIVKLFAIPMEQVLLLSKQRVTVMALEVGSLFAKQRVMVMALEEGSLFSKQVMIVASSATVEVWMTGEGCATVSGRVLQ
jgi:hypothetical protein